MKLVDDIVFEFKGRHCVRKEGEIVLAGSNPSAEGEDGDDGSDEHVERGIDFVLNHKLVVSTFHSTEIWVFRGKNHARSAGLFHPLFHVF